MAEDGLVGSILVQISGTDQYVEVFIDELPDDVQDVLDLLRAELAPLEAWHAFAVEYYRQGYKEAFREILKEAKEGFVHYEQNKKFSVSEKKEFDKARLNIILALAADQMANVMELQATDKARHNELVHEIKTYFGQADRIDPEFKLTWACKSLFEIATRKDEEYVEKAEYWADLLMKDSRKGAAGGAAGTAHIPTLLLKASAHFQRGEKAATGVDVAGAVGGGGSGAEREERRRKEFETALRLYETVLRAKPDCDATVRLGVGLCCARLGQTERARAAFRRTLDLSGGENVDAKLGLMLLELSAIPSHAPDRAVRQQKAARELVVLAQDSSCASPMVLNHAANAAFWSFDRVRCGGGEKEKEKEKRPSRSNLTVAVAQGSSEISVTLDDKTTSAANDALDASERADEKKRLGLGDTDMGDQDDIEGALESDGTEDAVANELPEQLVANVPVRIGSTAGGVLAVHGNDAHGSAANKELYLVDPIEHSSGKAVVTLHLSEPWEGKTSSGLRLFCPDYKRVERLAGSAYWYSKNKEIRAESYYLLGRTDHARRNYSKAERYYTGAINLSPNFAPAHYGLAQMQMHNNEYSKAIASLEKAVRAMPNALEALYLLAKLHFELASRAQTKRDHRKEREHSKKALEYVDRAKAVDPSNAEVWLLRGQLLQGDPRRREDACESFGRAVALLREQKQPEKGENPILQSPPVQATVLTNLGSLQFELGRIEDARDSYLAALEADFADFKMAQDQLSGAAAAAAKRLRTLYISEPANRVFWEWRQLPGTVSAPKDATVLTPSEDLTVVGVGKNSQLQLSFNPDTLLSRVSSVTAVMDIGLGATMDEQVIGESASSLSSSTSSSSSSSTASDSFGLRGGDLHVEVSVDLAVTSSAIPLKRSVPAALDRARVALKVVRLPLQPSNKTTAFNLAVVHEELGEWYAAMEIYKAILVKFPSHKDAQLRLSGVHRQLGATTKAQTYLERVSKLLPKDPDSAAMIGALHMEAFHDKGKSAKLEAAKGAFEKIQKMDSKLQKDPYAMLAVANIYFGNLHRTTPENYLKELGWAKAFYESSLTSHRDNVFAANGLGMILAEEGNLQQAKDIFSRVKNVAADVAPDAVVNLAHLLMIDERYLEAAKNYSSILRRAPHLGKDPELLLLTANAHFCDGRHQDALKSLSRALRSAPHKVELWSNVAVVEYSFAEDLFNRHLRPDRASQSIIKDIEAAQDYVASALKIFQWLFDGLSKHKTKFDNASRVNAEDGENDMDIDGASASSSSLSSVQAVQHEEEEEGEEELDNSNGSLSQTWAARLRVLGMDEKKLGELVGHCHRALEEAPERLRIWKEFAEQQTAEKERLEAVAAQQAAEEEAARVEAKKKKEAEKHRIAERARLKQQMLDEVNNIERTAMEHASQETRVDKKSDKKEQVDSALYDDPGADNMGSNYDKPDFGSSDDEPGSTYATPAISSIQADLGLDSDDDDDGGGGGGGGGEDRSAGEGNDAPFASKRSAAALGLDSDDDNDDDSGGGGGIRVQSASKKRLKKRVDMDEDSDENEFDTTAKVAPNMSGGLGLSDSDDDA